MADLDPAADNGADDMDARSQAGKAVDDATELFNRLTREIKADWNSHAQTTWRTEAREDFAFEAGDQLKPEDKTILEELGRPVVTFNLIGTTTDSVTGQEVANRQEVQYVPRQQGVVKQNEMLTAAAKWFRQECDAEDEESDAFRDTVICGMGWTETRLDYEDDPSGEPKIDRTDPLEMGWDRTAKKRNLVDAKRVFHVRRDVPIEEARALCPGDPDYPFEDADYNASWLDLDASDAKDGEGVHHNTPQTYDKPNQGDGEDDEAGDKAVTLVRVQWWERVPAYLTADPSDPTGRSITTLSREEYAQLQLAARVSGAALPRVVKTTRKVYRQAYIGNVLLEVGDAPVPGHFSFKCITGKRDRNKNTFFGIVRAMKDPARWANKWMSQTMHILNTSAKGGIMVERGQFFDNDNDGESSFAKQDQVTFLKPGALGGKPKFAPKPQSQFPQGSFQLMQYAVSMLPRVSGVNVETLGMQADAGQAAALDRQRKQSVMILLQPLFDGLRRYRKEQGRVMLYIIQHFIPDGTLIKIEGPDQAQFVPFIKQTDAKYQVIVDEAPTSANQKEATWAILQQLLPVIGKMLPPPVWLALLKYSPLPTSAQGDIQQAMQQSQQQPDPAQQQRDAELKLQNDKAQADIANHKAASDAKIQTMQQESAAKLQLERERAQHDAMLKALTAPPTLDPVTGQPVQGSGSGETAALVMGLMQQMRQEQAELKQTLLALAQAQSAPKQIIRDPQTGDIVGLAPMQQGA